ncbi:hypothetical protein WJX74_009008 [Apatococcus lobatus]|uniref:Uncharacterized protein n=1 Tax=Apatococcus lobatus TaxID=904363 RepID=A0AAW1R184_9CHLO
MVDATATPIATKKKWTFVDYGQAFFGVMLILLVLFIVGFLGFAAVKFHRETRAAEAAAAAAAVPMRMPVPMA